MPRALCNIVLGAMFGLLLSRAIFYLDAITH